MWWAQELEKRTHGHVRIKFFWSQSLVKAKENLKAVGSGLAEMGTIFGNYTPADLPIWNFATAPFNATDPWVGMRTWQELRQILPELRAEAANKNVRILMNFTSGPADLLSKEPILSAEDLVGKKIRTTGGWTTLLKALGAAPVKMGFAEIYQALDRGTIDGTINYIPFVRSYKHYEVASHVSEVRMGQALGYGAGINLELWSDMPKEIQEALAAVSDEFIERYAEAYLKDANDAKRTLIRGIDGKSVVFHEISDKELDRWRAKARSFTDDWLERMEGKGVDTKRILETIQSTHAKWEKELASKGYPWTR